MTLRTFLCAALVGLGLTGCKSFNAGELLTPARVKAVASVASYYGAKAAIAKGHQAQVVSALAALKTLNAAQEPDLTAVLAAIEAGGITFGATAEGEFIFSAGAIVFSDFWQQTGRTALNEPLVKAFIDGVIRGATLASDHQPESAPTQRRPTTKPNTVGPGCVPAEPWPRGSAALPNDATGDLLKAAAKATR